jgi:hypothetical protein
MVHQTELSIFTKRTSNFAGEVLRKITPLDATRQYTSSLSPVPCWVKSRKFRDFVQWWSSCIYIYMVTMCMYVYHYIVYVCIYIYYISPGYLVMQWRNVEKILVVPHVWGQPPLQDSTDAICENKRKKAGKLFLGNLLLRILYQSRSECSYNARVNSFRLPCNFSETFRGESLDELNHWPDNMMTCFVQP